ncbi:Protocadherin gamma-C5 [Triplophysa tibetana]|uniref:Protocadherin gamma-C5 n=1 Tax=Triplophysa tibetana TaxID=1572043 RepID=A0A5A9N4F8_9TELE|nr:Protocadherin gamma-C5 [Triplophysa tibetana]
MSVGSIVGNIASDLGLEPKRLISGKARVFTAESSEYIGLDKENGHLIIKSKIDREELCGDISACSVSFDVILDNPMELYRVTVDIEDINDNSPAFQKSNIELEISELAVLGARFPLESAIDSDVGMNTLQKYSLHPTDHFKLNVQSGAGETKHVEMILHSPLDREKNKHHHLILTAFDGGKPQRSTTVKINIIVIDVNDNAPVFSQSSYKASVVENAAKGSVVTTNDNAPQILYPVQTGGSVVAEIVPRSADVGYLVTKVVAVDVDSGQNAWLSYKLQKATDRALFEVGLQNGEIRTVRQVTDKDAVKQKLTVVVEDNGQPSRSAVVTINVAVADNFPEVLNLAACVALFTRVVLKRSVHSAAASLHSAYSARVASFVASRIAPTPLKLTQHKARLSNTAEAQIRYTFQEELREGSVVGNIAKDLGLDVTKVIDRKLQIASENENGKVRLTLTPGQPFRLSPTISNHYAILTNGPLDRESYSEYKVVLNVVDAGSPSQSSWKVITIGISDVNDNPPVFSDKSYTVYVKENSGHGSILCSVLAHDPDLGENAKISYSILDSKIQDVPVSSYIYINSENGSLFSMQSFDFEKIKVFQIHVQAKDHGTPSLSSNATVHVFILDQNDNVPAVIYPSTATGSVSYQRMPRSAKIGHLVTKVTAVDADSGHNAWLFYRLAEATDASLFNVNLHTGEVRTKRSVSEQDDPSQRLLIEIKDNGEPIQSTTVTVDILIEDGFPEPISDYRLKTTEDNKKNGKITLYLIISLGTVSVFSLLTIFTLIVKCVKNSVRNSGCCVRRTDSGYTNPNRNLQIQLNTDGPIKYVEVLGGDMMSQSQSFGSYLSPMSEFSDLTLIKPSSTTTFSDTLNVLDASLPDSAWTFECQQVTPHSVSLKLIPAMTGERSTNNAAELYKGIYSLPQS